MGQVKLPAEIEDLKDGPHKRDMIRHYKKMLRNKRKDFSYYHRQNIKFGITEMETWYDK